VRRTSGSASHINLKVTNATAHRPSFGFAQDRLPEATREMKPSSNYANHQCQKAVGVCPERSLFICFPYGAFGVTRYCIEMSLVPL